MRLSSRVRRRLWGVAALAALASAMGGCAAVAIAGKAIEDVKPKRVQGEYQGMTGKSFAVAVVADRAIQADFPSLVPEVTARVSQLLAEGAKASGFVPPADVLRYQATRPQWVVMDRGELAAALGGVERLVVIEISEFRLREPGNKYLWNGVAAGTVAVMETDGPLPDEHAFERVVAVGFPDSSGYGPEDFGAPVVATELVRRFSNRAAWLLFDHTEPPGTDY